MPQKRCRQNDRISTALHYTIFGALAYIIEKFVDLCYITSILIKDDESWIRNRKPVNGIGTSGDIKKQH